MILKRILTTCAALFVFSQILFLINIQFPRTANFDEFHYVPSAKQFLELRENQNWEHPPLAKEIMAVGIGVFGDRPIGWRYMSTLFGSLTLVGMYLLALAILRNPGSALWVALLTLVNQLLYVQARIGMLDTFMMAFIVWALACFCALWTYGRELGLREKRALLRLCGACLGFGVACKWFTVIPWALCIGSAIGIGVLRRWKLRFGDPLPEDFFEPEQWAEIPRREWWISLGLIPLAAYYVTFVPYFFVQGNHTTIPDVLFGMQAKMWDGQGRVVSSHPYMSTWTQWATLKRPIWYAFDREGTPPQTAVRGVILLGNPFVLWTGLLAIAYCFFSWLRTRRRDAFLILLMYGGLYFSWAIIPRKVNFFYYYYPAGMILCLALCYFFDRYERGGTRRLWARWAYLGIAAGFFIYFFPISAALRISPDRFRDWMWLSSWI